MNTLAFGKSKTRQKIFALFLANPGQAFYLHQMKRKLSLSAGNLRRELLSLVNIGLFERIKEGRLIYYKINSDSPILAMIKIPDDLKIVNTALRWSLSPQTVEIAPEHYCQTRDIFAARLDTVTSRLQKTIRDDGYLLSAIAGEIGNNSFDHNLGRWPDVPGICFVHLASKKTIILADRGQGILKTIRNVLPKTKNDQEALNVAFTKIISGRSPEKRGNGLKFVTQVVKAQKWSLKFDSGRASVIIDRLGKMKIKKNKQIVRGCLAIINY